MSNLILYVITVVIWGSTWFAIEFQLGVVEPEVSLVYRYATASLLLFAWCAIRRLSLRFNPASHLWFAALGFFLFGLNYILAYRAQIHITSALTAITFSTLIWMNIINSRIFFGVRAGRRVLFGGLLGVIGIFSLFAPQVGEISLTDSILFGSLLSMGGALVASLGNMVSQGAQRRKLPVVQSNAYGMLYGSLLTGAYALYQGFEFTFDPSPDYVISLAYLSVFGSIVAFGAYLTLLGRIGADKAGYAMVMFPVVALILSALFEGLEIDGPTILGTVFVLLGNVFVLRAADPVRSNTTTRFTRDGRSPSAASG